MLLAIPRAAIRKFLFPIPSCFIQSSTTFLSHLYFLIAGKYKTTVSQIAPVAQQKGYTVLSWEQYIELLDEIGTLIGE